MSTAGFASLHGGLLARKGAAAPSAGKPTLVHGGAGDAYSAQRRDVAQDGGPPARSAFGTRGDARSRRDALEEAMSNEFARPRAAGEGDAARAARATLRLTREQLRRLRLAAALMDVSQQELLAEALDDKLAALARGPLRDCRCFRPGAAARGALCRETDPPC